ncbi:MAG: iron-containing alcohol dehydrogenase [Verrucomicrobiota bacterium]
MRFEITSVPRIIFGPGTFKEVGGIAREFGARALVVTGGDPSRVGQLGELLKSHGVASAIFSLNGEPKTTDVEAGLAQARQLQAELVISCGGGSAIDCGKAIAAMLTNEGELLDYLEVIGKGRPIMCPGAPFIAIPTTAGTGAELTRNAVLASPEHGVKVSLRSPLMLARVALVDPELTLSLPPEITAATGLDALTQLIEPYTCNRANPMTDGLCLEGLQRAARSLREVFTNGTNLAAREDMCAASLFSGFALANAGLGAAHGFAAPIGGQFPAPHGAVCAALLPQVMRQNLMALRQRAPGSDSLARYQTVARALTGNSQAKAEDSVDWVSELTGFMRIPPLRVYGIRREDFPGLVAKAAKASSMKANPIALTVEELTGILEQAWQSNCGIWNADCGM